MSHTVASDDEEFIVVREIMDHDIRIGSYNLLLRRKVGALLELKVANGP